MIRAVPIYDYRCDACGHAFSAVQSYQDATLEACPQCGARPRKLMVSPAIVFKGSGWYKTDSRKGSSDARADAKADGKLDAKGDRGDAKGDAKGDATAKPVAKGDAKGETSGSGPPASAGKPEKSAEAKREPAS